MHNLKSKLKANFICLEIKEYICLLTHVLGEVAEWSNAAVLKTVIPRDRDQGFESLPLLHQKSPKKGSLMISYRQLFIKLVFLLVIQGHYIPNSYAAADFIIFSYDRPMQLYALLESTARYLTGIDSTTVIYRVSDERFAHAYTIVQKQFPYVQFLLQSTKAQADFKPLVMQALKTGKSPYILFAPDDIIVKNYANLEVCTRAMEQHNAYGFFLRLGTHLDTCYSEAQPQPLPSLIAVGNNIFTWTFRNNKFDWGYPNNVDMTIYRKHDIQRDLESAAFTTPNTMEACWAGLQWTVIDRKGLCFNNSVIVNIPVNCVQQDFNNNQMHSWTPQQLLRFFEDGKKIAIEPLAGILNKSCHIDHELSFIER